MFIGANSTQQKNRVPSDSVATSSDRINSTVDFGSMPRVKVQPLASETIAIAGQFSAQADAAGVALASPLLVGMGTSIATYFIAACARFTWAGG